MNDLEILVTQPEETLEAEYKEWLLLNQKPHKAKLAKELIALANHGGWARVKGEGRYRLLLAGGRDAVSP